jgi:hypothetical protein
VEHKILVNLFKQEIIEPKEISGFEQIQMNWLFNEVVNTFLSIGDWDMMLKLYSWLQSKYKANERSMSVNKEMQRIVMEANVMEIPLQYYVANIITDSKTSHIRLEAATYLNDRVRRWFMAEKFLQKAAKSMKKHGTTGTFSAAAKSAGMSTLAYANKILRSNTASPLMKKRANFAKNAIKISRGK